MAIDQPCTAWGGTARRSLGRGESPRADSQSRPTRGRPRGGQDTCSSRGMRGGQTGSRSPNPRPISPSAPTRPPERGGPTLPAAPRPGRAWLRGRGPPQSPPGFLPRLQGEFRLDRRAPHGGHTAGPCPNPPRAPEKNARTPSSVEGAASVCGGGGHCLCPDEAAGCTQQRREVWGKRDPLAAHPAPPEPQTSILEQSPPLTAGNVDPTRERKGHASGHTELSALGHRHGHLSRDVPSAGVIF